uniref:Uncharacterized protein n=1 Tax=Arundo donax TaxID=35708 RepID=A0A0A9FWG6_ARUDO
MPHICQYIANLVLDVYDTVCKIVRAT